MNKNKVLKSTMIRLGMLLSAVELMNIVYKTLDLNPRLQKQAKRNRKQMLERVNSWTSE